jgi:hypothetical protein
MQQEVCLRFALILTLGTALAVGAVAVSAQTPAKPAAQPTAAAHYDRTKPYPAYTAPRLKIGQPDLQGFWSNTTLTKMTRPRDVSGLVYTEAQAKDLEQAMVEEIEEGAAPTAANAPAEYVIPKDIKPEYLAGGGATGGYNRFWIDPGNLVMRVNGEPRTSVFTTPNGQAPAPRRVAHRSIIRNRAPPSAASSRSAATPGRRCSPTASITTATSSFSRRIMS